MSWNVNGFGPCVNSPTSKSFLIRKRMLEEKISILLIQETHCTSYPDFLWINFWPKFHTYGSGIATNSGGVAFISTLPISKFEYIVPGAVIAVTIDGQLFINIYGLLLKKNAIRSFSPSPGISGTMLSLEAILILISSNIQIKEQFLIPY